jgi:hypothetical protein
MDACSHRGSPRQTLLHVVWDVRISNTSLASLQLLALLVCTPMLGIT